MSEKEVNPSLQANKMDSRVFTISLEKGIFYCRIKSYSECTLEDGKQMVDATRILGKGKKYPMLTTIEDFVSSDTELKKFMSKKENNKYVSASAVLTKSLGYRIGTNLFIKFFKPEIPTKLFTSKPEAIRWLQQFL
jgi:hypothetical protein